MAFYMKRFIDTFSGTSTVATREKFDASPNSHFLHLQEIYHDLYKST